MNFELDWLKKWNLYSPTRRALTDGVTGRSLSYRDAFLLAQKMAELLRKDFSVKRGDRIAVLAGNSLEYVLLFFAAQRLGAILVPINFRLTSREVSHILEDSGAKVLFHDEETTSVVSLLDNSAKPQFTTLFGRVHSIVAEAYEWLGQDLELPDDTFVAEPEDIAMILYTSGTTGTPKGAMLSHRMIFWNSINTGLRLNLSQSDKTVIFLPLFHTGGWNVLTTPFLHRGAEIILLPKFDADQVLRLSEASEATILFGVPTTMNMMAQHPKFETFKLDSIRYAIVGGEAMPKSLIEKWAARQIPVRQGYGLTEFGPNVFSLNEEDSIRKIGSIGFANFYIETKVVDLEGNAVAPGEIGELILKGPCCMSGYWQNEKATQETIRDGWLHTGDLVTQDPQGFFYVAGRKKEMFISGGENVYPAEIEQVIHSLPQVKEVAVIGVTDETWGEVGKAFISLKESRQPFDLEELKAHCLKNLAKFKVPKSFQILDELPKGDSGKIQKRRLIDL